MSFFPFSLLRKSNFKKMLEELFQSEQQLLKIKVRKGQLNVIKAF